MAYKQNYDLVIEQIKPLIELCEAGAPLDECNAKAEEILNFMRTIELGRDEVRALKDEILRAKRIPMERAREAEQERLRRDREIEKEKRDKIQTLKDQLNAVLHEASSMDVDALMLKRDQLTTLFEEVALSKAEKQIVDRLFKQLKDAVDDKREKALLQLSDDDLKALDELKAVLEERKTRRQEIKNQLENYRKQLGGSGFDFEKAMMYREMIEAEKASLEKVNASIDEIEEKIAEIEG